MAHESATATWVIDGMTPAPLRVERQLATRTGQATTTLIAFAVALWVLDAAYLFLHL
jgi:hypothetical protein